MNLSAVGRPANPAETAAFAVECRSLATSESIGAFSSYCNSMNGGNHQKIGNAANMRGFLTMADAAWYIGTFVYI
jgi:hypothetical protein